MKVFHFELVSAFYNFAWFIWFLWNYSMNMQDPRISAALSVMMGINLMGDDDKMETEPSPPPSPKQKRVPTPPPPAKEEDEGITEEQKQVPTYFYAWITILKLIKTCIVLYSLWNAMFKKMKLVILYSLTKSIIYKSQLDSFNSISNFSIKFVLNNENCIYYNTVNKLL